MQVFRERRTSKGATSVHLDLPLSDRIDVASLREAINLLPTLLQKFPPRSVFPFNATMLTHICMQTNMHKYTCIYILYTHI